MYPIPQGRLSLLLALLRRSRDGLLGRLAVGLVLHLTYWTSQFEKLRKPRSSMYEGRVLQVNSSTYSLYNTFKFVSDSYFLVLDESCRNSKTLPVTFLKSERKMSGGIDHIGKYGLESSAP